MGRRRTTVLVDEALFERARADLPVEVSLSSILEDGLRAKLAEVEECAHPVLRCTRCRSVVRTAEPVDG